jgi:hypothetical protein
MSFFKTAAVAALVATAGFGASMSAAEAHGKKHFGVGIGNPYFYNYGYGYGGKTIVIGSPGYGCKHWLKKYKWTGNPYFLNRYYDCLY